MPLPLTARTPAGRLRRALRHVATRHLMAELRALTDAQGAERSIGARVVMDENFHSTSTGVHVGAYRDANRPVMRQRAIDRCFRELAARGIPASAPWTGERIPRPVVLSATQVTILARLLAKTPVPASAFLLLDGRSIYGLMVIGYITRVHHEGAPAYMLSDAGAQWILAHQAARRSA